MMLTDKVFTKFWDGHNNVLGGEMILLFCHINIYTTNFPFVYCVNVYKEKMCGFSTVILC